MPASRRWSSTSTAMRGRSTCCSSWRASRRSISPSSRSSRSPTSISPSSPRSAGCGSRSPPTIWSWRRGSPISNRACCCPSRRPTMTARAARSWRRRSRHRLRLLGRDAARRRAADGAAAARAATCFVRGTPEGLPRIDRPVYELSLYELLAAYGDGHRRQPYAGADDRAAGLPFARRRAAPSRAAYRPGAANGASWPPFCRRSCAARCSAARRSPRPSPRAWSWPAPAASSCARTARSGRSTCAARRRRAVMRHERAASAAAAGGAAVRRSRAARRNGSGNRGSATAPTSPRCCASWPRAMPGAASTWCGWPAAGPSAPRPISLPLWRASGWCRANCRAPRSRPWRSSPTTSR